MKKNKPSRKADARTTAEAASTPTVQSPSPAELKAVDARDPASLTQLAQPEPPPADRAVRPRADAVVDPETVRIWEEAAVKENAFPSRPGYPSGMANLQTHLHVEAWVRNVTFEKNLWADAHVFDDGGALIHAETLPLHYARPAGDGGDVFVLDHTLYHGLVATPGAVTPRPDARTVQFRLYGEMDGHVFTDGVLHHCYLRPDFAST